MNASIHVVYKNGTLTVGYSGDPLQVVGILEWAKLVIIGEVKSKSPTPKPALRVVDNPPTP